MDEGCIPQCYSHSRTTWSAPCTSDPCGHLALRPWISVHEREFETCPDWGPVVDKVRDCTPILLKAIRVYRFDHSASRVAKVRNVSMPGSQLQPPCQQTASLPQVADGDEVRCIEGCVRAPTFAVFQLRVSPFTGLRELRAKRTFPGRSGRWAKAKWAKAKVRDQRLGIY